MAQRHLRPDEPELPRGLTASRPLSVRPVREPAKNALLKVIVIVGATGDLAQRMLFPSLYFLDAENLLPASFRIIAASRSAHTTADFTDIVETTVRNRTDGYFDEAVWARFAKRLSYCVVDAGEPNTFNNLCMPLTGARNVIFYLSTSPSLYGAISANLRAAGVVRPDSRVIVEKPIGHDLESCREINDALAETFDEQEIFRIDHYLGKESVQNLDRPALRQRPVRAAVEQGLHRPRADHGRRDGWGRRGAGPITTTTARCVTWCRTTSCSCSAWWRWSRRPTSTRTRCATRRSRCCAPLRPDRGPRGRA